MIYLETDGRDGGGSRKGDFQAGDDEGSETWQWVGWNIKLA